MKTELQKKFEKQTPSINGIRGNEYNLVYCTWLEHQIKVLKEENKLMRDLGSHQYFEQKSVKQAEQIKELKDKAREIVEMYILTTPTDKESGATMVVSKLAKPIIEMNELLNKH